MVGTTWTCLTTNMGACQQWDHDRPNVYVDVHRHEHCCDPANLQHEMPGQENNLVFDWVAVQHVRQNL